MIEHPTRSWLVAWSRRFKRRYGVSPNESNWLHELYRAVYGPYWKGDRNCMMEMRKRPHEPVHDKLITCALKWDREGPKEVSNYIDPATLRSTPTNEL